MKRFTLIVVVLTVFVMTSCSRILVGDFEKYTEILIGDWDKTPLDKDFLLVNSFTKVQMTNVVTWSENPKFIGISKSIDVKPGLQKVDLLDLSLDGVDIGSVYDTQLVFTLIE